MDRIFRTLSSAFMLLILVFGLGATVYFLQSGIKTTFKQHASSGAAPSDGQGIYDSCSAKCLDHLDLFSQMGFKEVLDYSIWGNVSTTDVINYANRAEQDHIKIIWSLKDMWNDKWTTFSSYGQLTKDCGCSNKQQLTTYLINKVKNLPATWGYYIADEPNASDYGTVSSFSNLVHQTDPSHPRLIIQYDGNAFAQFAPVTDVLGYDYYPTANGVDINRTGTLASTAQSVADGYHIQSAMVLEVNAGINSKFPSAQQMQTQLDQTVQNSHTKLVLWYWYPQTPVSSLEALSQVVNSLSPLPPVPSDAACIGDPAPGDGATNTESPIIKGVANLNTVHSITNFNWQAHDGPALGTWPQVIGKQSQSLMGNTTYCARAWCDQNNMVYESFTWTPGYTTWQNPIHNDYSVTYWFLGQNNNNQFGATKSVSGNTLTVRVGPSYFFSNTNAIVKVANHYGETGWPHTSWTLPSCTQQSTPTPTPTATPAPSSNPTPTATPIPTGNQPLVGDLNGDGKVDIVDLNILTHCFNHTVSQKDAACPNPTIADMDKDGVIDGVDYNLWLRAFIDYEKAHQ